MELVKESKGRGTMATASRIPHLLILGLLLCALRPLVTHAGKLLVVPVEGSHWLSMVGALQQLQQNGHEIVVLAPDALLYIKEDSPFTLKRYPVPFSKEDLETNFALLGHFVFENDPFLIRVIKMYKKIKKDSAMLFSGCSHLLHNKELMASLVESSFDVVLTDPFLPCGAIVAQYLVVPAVFFLYALPCGMHFEATLCPNPMSYVPRSMSLNPDHMTFLQRVKNALITLTEKVACNFVYSAYAPLASEVLQRDVTVHDLISSASFWLFRNDFVFDYPKPVMPNTAFIGGINCLHKNLLSQVCI